MGAINEVERVETARKKRAVFDMRQAAYSYRAIADALELSIPTVRAYYLEMSVVLIPTEEVDEIRARDIDGYDNSERLTLHSIELVTKAIDEDTREGKPLNDKRIALLRDLNSQLIDIRRNRALLTGANKPVQVNHNVDVRVTYDEQVEALTSELLGGGNLLSGPDEILVEDQ